VFFQDRAELAQPVPVEPVVVLERSAALRGALEVQDPRVVEDPDVVGDVP
jgi:hypothetical protein